MTTAKNQTPSKPPATRAAKAAETAPTSAEAAETPAAKPSPSDTGQARGPKSGPSVTIPLDSGIVDVAVKAVTLPVTTARKVARNKNGLPAYLAVGGLVVVGAVEWPVAAATGLGLAALRRWGPLKPEPAEAAAE